MEGKVKYSYGKLTVSVIIKADNVESFAAMATAFKSKMIEIDSKRKNLEIIIRSIRDSISTSKEPKEHKSLANDLLIATDYFTPEKNYDYPKELDRYLKPF